jgi:hypothetical protein
LRGRVRGIPHLAKTPDFLSGSVAQASFLRLSIRESRARGHNRRYVVGNPGSERDAGHPRFVAGIEFRAKISDRIRVDGSILAMECTLQDFSQMHGLPSRGLKYLLAATETVGNNECIRIRLPHRRQEYPFADGL